MQKDQIWMKTSNLQTQNQILENDKNPMKIYQSIISANLSQNMNQMSNQKNYNTRIPTKNDSHKGSLFNKNINILRNKNQTETKENRHVSSQQDYHSQQYSQNSDNFKQINIDDYLKQINKEILVPGGLEIKKNNENGSKYFQYVTQSIDQSQRSSYKNVKSRIFQYNDRKHVESNLKPDLEEQPKDQKKSSAMSSLDNIKWLKKRYQKSTMPKYLKTNLEMEQDQEIKEVFMKIDFDGSGKIDVNELRKMFQQNGIDLSKKEIQCFFDLCKTQSKGYLNMDEFSQLYKNTQVDQLFRFFIKRARQVNQDLANEGIQKIYLPFNLSRLLEHMTLKQRRETVQMRIEEGMKDLDKTLETVKNFVKLFIIDKGAIDTISKDEWARKISFCIMKREFEEKKARGEKLDPNQLKEMFQLKTQESLGLRRLDSLHLNQLTSKVFESPLKRKQNQSNCFQVISNSPSQKSPQKSMYSPSKLSFMSTSPLKKLGKLKLESIDEKDSFCTDMSFKSPIRKSPEKARNLQNGLNLQTFKCGLKTGSFTEVQDQIKENLLKLFPASPKNECVNEQISPIKRMSDYRSFGIQDIIQKARIDAKEAAKKIIQKNFLSESSIKKNQSLKDDEFAMSKLISNIQGFKSEKKQLFEGKISEKNVLKKINPFNSIQEISSIINDKKNFDKNEQQVEILKVKQIDQLNLRSINFQNQFANRLNNSVNKNKIPLQKIEKSEVDLNTDKKIKAKIQFVESQGKNQSELEKKISQFQMKSPQSLLFGMRYQNNLSQHQIGSGLISKDFKSDEKLNSFKNLLKKSLNNQEQKNQI